jgi:hypothetical protein
LTAAKNNLRNQPYRLLTKGEAAHYCRLPAKKFASLCPARPIAIGPGDRRWDVRDLDDWIDSLKTNEHGDIDAILARLA